MSFFSLKIYLRRLKFYVGLYPTYATYDFQWFIFNLEGYVNPVKCFRKLAYLVQPHSIYLYSNKLQFPQCGKDSIIIQKKDYPNQPALDDNGKEKLHHFDVDISKSIFFICCQLVSISEWCHMVLVIFSFITLWGFCRCFLLCNESSCLWLAFGPHLVSIYCHSSLFQITLMMSYLWNPSKYSEIHSLEGTCTVLITLVSNCCHLKAHCQLYMLNICYYYVYYDKHAEILIY